MVIKSDVTGDYLTQTEKSAQPQRQGRSGHVKTRRSDDCGADYRARLARVNGSYFNAGQVFKLPYILNMTDNETFCRENHLDRRQ
jgi:hypothetical protein